MESNLHFLFLIAMGVRLSLWNWATYMPSAHSSDYTQMKIWQQWNDIDMLGLMSWWATSMNRAEGGQDSL
jgi:hypothetical protein